MHKILKRTISVLVLLCLMTGMLFYVSGALIMKRDDGITSMQDYYAQKENTVDLLIMGSSHAATNVDTEMLWSDYGISAYTLWGSRQPAWNTYYFLKEALKTQKPQLVLMDVFGMLDQDEYEDEARQITNTQGMRMGLNKIQAIQASSPKEDHIDMILGLPYWHERWKELTADDFRHYPWSEGLINNKGELMAYGTWWTADLSFTPTEDVTPLSAKQETYLRKIIELCKTEDIPLMLVLTPTSDRQTLEPYCNAVAAIAREYDVEFVDLNRLDSETGIDPSSFQPDASHLNKSGADLVTTWLLKHWKETYQFEDHRSDPAYASWDIYARNEQNNILSSVWNLETLHKELHTHDRALLVLQNGISDSEGYRKTTGELEQYFGIALDQTGDRCVMVQEHTDGSGNAEVISAGQDLTDFEISGTAVHVDFASGTLTVNGVKAMEKIPEGITIAVIDLQSQKAVDVMNFTEDGDYTLSRG